MTSHSADNPLRNSDLEPTSAAHLCGFGPMLSSPSQFVAGGKGVGQFWLVFWPSLTAMVGYWTTLALNIPDFTRFARSQRDQMVGQALGLPLPMGLLSLVAVLVTSATVVIYGEAIWDPVVLTGKMGGISVVIALIALIVATITTNLAANVVSPAYDSSNLAPRKISFSGWEATLLPASVLRCSRGKYWKRPKATSLPG